MGNKYNTRIKIKLVKVRNSRKMVVKVVLVDNETYIIKLI